MALRVVSIAYWGIASALVATPSLPQNVSLHHTFTQFMHYGPCTFISCQWDIPWSPPSVFAPPDDASTDGWVETAAMYGASQICLTVRHVDGFALWPTQSNNYSVAASPWRGGKGDVVRDFVTSVRKYGLSPCFYIILG
jgi:alpha-L-fucosidase